MIITGTDNFQNICRQRLVEWYNGQDFGKREPITLDNTFNGGKKELYEDVYKKIVNQAYTEEFLELTHEYSCAIKK